MMRKSKLLFLVLLCMITMAVRAQARKSVVIEVVAPYQKYDMHRFFSVCDKYHIKRTDYYTWKNHTVIFGAYQLVYPQLKASLKELTIKLYDNPFYDFERSRCSDKTEAKYWDHVILTANLVNNERMQHEYLAYHATQFEKWPEVSQGFCNANFQQLLVFKNGRQLMLVISIPKGKTLDELNPLTTKDNPKVDEWNKIMSKYQEGVAGTDKGETWVFFKPIVKD